ncbi:MAG: vWA domain-containing protein [Kofleriaceae bacterium]
MPLLPQQLRSYLARQVGTMVLSLVACDNPMAPVRAASWHNSLQRMGVHLPLFVIHDLGVMLSMSRGVGGYELRPRDSHLARVFLPAGAKGLLKQYQRLLENVAESEVLERLSGLRLRDEMISVLLGRVLSDCYNRWKDRGKKAGVEVLPLDLAVFAEIDYAEHYREFDSRSLWGFVDHLASQSMHIYTQVELIDLDTVRLLGLFKEESASGSEALGSTIDLVDLFAVLNSPESADVANFSLDLLPSVLETRRSTATQTFSVDGYASIERKGPVDSLVLTELAYDREIFEQKVVDNELLYYGHDKQREEERQLQVVLIDCSASMRGQRQVFARGLALALVKKLTLQGDEVWLRFFDSRLHETVKITRSGQVPVPYVLSFRSERGRNYGKVFRQLLLELTKLRRDQKRRIILYIITHGQCHLNPELVTALKQQAYVYGIIVLPSGDQLPEFVPVLHRQQIVGVEAFNSRAERQRRALDIVGDSGGATKTPRTGAR